MLIDLSKIDTESFMVHQHVVNGNVLHLIQPIHIGCAWQADTLHFRSSLWNSDGELVSAGHKKFFNLGEKPELSPPPSSLNNCNVVTKVDGSLLIVSKYHGHLIIRTRGTVDATKLDNGHELQLFVEKYLPNICAMEQGDTWNYSYLFEWTSPLQRIVIDYGITPEWHLVGRIHHTDYSLTPQAQLDSLAKQIGCPRPETYAFPSLKELIASIGQWTDREGVCLYSNGDQTIHKCKSEIYLAKHRFKSEATLENTLELYFSMGKPSYQEFERQLVATFDYECFTMVRGYASNICDAAKQVQQIVDGIDEFVNETLRPLPTRRAQAEKVLASYGQTNRSAFVFARLDNKVLNDDQMKKIFWQVLKK